ncbi:MAG: hypothetical protein K0S61_154 [Anaerocolumna sp.]|jgi:hypothetical protein|nr:hypothetical protein [Anaerocolumna sp.]
MIKIIRIENKKEKVTKMFRCRNCEIMLEAQEEDWKDISSYGSIQYAVQCPICKRQATEHKGDIDHENLSEKEYVNLRNKEEKTYGDIYRQFRLEMKIKEALIDDYRPCVETYGVPYMPNAIVVWLKSGSRIIYIA